jgi:hypothetical protein
LNDQNALQYSAIDKRDTEKRVIVVLSRFAKIFEPRMVSNLFDRDRAYFLRYKPGQSFVQRHA